jgi:hypothetical protein
MEKVLFLVEKGIVLDHQINYFLRSNSDAVLFIDEIVD